VAFLWLCIWSIVDITVTKEMSSVSVSQSKVLLFLVVDWQWNYGVYLSNTYVRNWVTR